MGKKLTTEEFIERATNVHNNKYDYSKVEYKNVDTKVIIICSEHGEFLQTPYYHMKGQGCPRCGRVRIYSSKTKNTEQFVKEASKIHNNKYNYSKTKYENCKKKVCIICPEHGEFWQTPTGHLAGKGCKLCANEHKNDKNKLTTEEFVKKAIIKHNHKYDYSKTNYASYHRKVCIICPEHGEFWQTPANHLFGFGCEKCGIIKRVNNNKKKTDEFIKQAIDIHGSKYDYSEVDYKGDKTYVNIICREHGVFEQTPGSHLQGSGCPKCSGRYMDTEFFIEKASSIHNNKYDYSKVEYKSVIEKVCIICPEHGEFWQTPGSHLSGSGCPKCGVDIRVAKESLTLEEFICRSNETHNNKYDYSLVEYINTQTKVKIICPLHGVFEQRPYKHYGEGNGCPKCSPKLQLEEDLYGLLVDKFGKDNIKRQYKEERYPFKCDFYIVSIDTFVELNGYWTHNDHFFDRENENDLNELEEWIKKAKKHDSYKSAIKTWTERDPLKKKTAEENNLNYKVFWKQDLSDAIEWLDSI